MKFALIKNGVVSNIIEAADLATAKSVDASAVTLAPPGGIGSTWDGANFSAPPGPPSVRQLSPVDYEQRFTQAERIAIEGSADPKVKDYLEMIKVASVIDLDNPLVSGGTNYLETSGIIAAGRAAQILA